MTNPPPSRPTLGANLRALQSKQKSSSGAPAYSRFVNRPLGRVFAAAAHSIGATPNQVTGVSAVFTFASIIALAVFPPSFLLAVLVAMGLILGYAFDSADGQLARLRGGGSPAGEWLDHVVDATKQATIHVAVLIGWARFFPVDGAWLLIPIGYGVVASVFFFGVILSELMRRLHAATHPVNTSASASTGKALRDSPLYALAVIPADYGLLCLVFVLWAAPPVFIVVYTLMFAANAAILALSLVRWYRGVKALV
jgi:phosphatidylglycerophosphate synthase